ncbi:MAG: hypothetical protein IPL83_20075 [Bdellovibrionales bacterium]|nr:hypothetical protein [Bdellovibrionales bacterium]
MGKKIIIIFFVGISLGFNTSGYASSQEIVPLTRCSSVVIDSNSHNNEDNSRSDNWNKHIGQIWEDLFLSVSLPLNGVVIEVAPGDVPKVGIGLTNINFHGTLIIIEPEKESAKKISALYKKLLPKAQLIVMDSKLDDVINKLPKNVDLIASNHPLDDMLVGEYLGSSAFQDFFNDHYNSPAEETRRIWQELELRSNINVLQARVAGSWNRVLADLHPKFLIISQYESFFFKSNGIASPDIHALNVLKLIKKNTDPAYYQEIPVLNARINQPNRWVILKKNSLKEIR